MCDSSVALAYFNDESTYSCSTDMIYGLIADIFLNKWMALTPFIKKTWIVYNFQDNIIKYEI